MWKIVNRGFLTSIMLEIAPGVYVSPDMSVSVRERTWNVLSNWWEALGNGSILAVTRDSKSVGQLRIDILGEAPKEIVDADGVLLVRRGPAGPPYTDGCLTV